MERKKTQSPYEPWKTSRNRCFTSIWDGLSKAFERLWKDSAEHNARPLQQILFIQEMNVWHIYFIKWEPVSQTNCQNEHYPAVFLATSINDHVLLFWETCQVRFERIVVLMAKSRGFTLLANWGSAKRIRRQRHSSYPRRQGRSEIPSTGRKWGGH